MGLHLVERGEPPQPAAPAHRRGQDGGVAGEHVGDVLVTIAGNDVRGLEFAEAMALMRSFGTEGMDLEFIRCKAGPPDGGVSQ